MAVESHRLESFQGAAVASGSTARPGRSKAALSKSSSSSSVTVKWPHSIQSSSSSSSSSHRDSDEDDDDDEASAYPHPRHLAAFGFFFSPTAQESDRVVSYLDGTSLSNFKRGDTAEDRLTEIQPDNPLLRIFESRAHARQQATSQNAAPAAKGKKSKAASQKHVYTFPSDLLPTGTIQQEARKRTFANLWPHDKKSGWNCTSAKVAEAGFIYNPTPSDPDCASCPLCPTSLGGWDPEDDPVQEHLARAAHCAFFNAKETEEETSKASSSSVAKSASKKTKSRQASTSEPAISDDSSPEDRAIEIPDDDEQDEVSEVPRKRSNRARVPKSAVRSKADTTTITVDDDDNDSDDTTRQAANRKPARGKTASGSSKKATSSKVASKTVPTSDIEHRDEVQPEEDGKQTPEADDPPPQQAPPQLSPRKTRSASRSKAKTVASMSTLTHDEEPPPTTKQSAHKRTDSASSNSKTTTKSKVKSTATKARATSKRGQTKKAASSSKPASAEVSEAEQSDVDTETEHGLQSGAEAEESHGEAEEEEEQPAKHLERDDEAAEETAVATVDDASGISEAENVGEEQEDTIEPVPTGTARQAKERSSSSRSSIAKAPPQEATAMATEKTSPDARADLGIGLATSTTTTSSEAHAQRVFSPLPNRQPSKQRAASTTTATTKDQGKSKSKGAESLPSEQKENAQVDAEDSFKSLDEPADASALLLPSIPTFSQHSILPPYTSLPPISTQDLDSSVQAYLQSQIEVALDEMKRSGEERVRQVEERFRVNRQRIEDVLRGKSSTSGVV